MKPSGDSSSRLGDTEAPASSFLQSGFPSMDMLFAVNQPKQFKARGASSLFGLSVGRHMLQSAIKSKRPSIEKWTDFPPFRFGVEFWDIDSLKGLESLVHDGGS